MVTPRYYKAAVLGASMLALSIGTAGAATIQLPVQNLTFSNYSGAAPKDYFSTVNPAGWQRGTPVSSDLVFIDAPGTATQTGGGPNSYPVFGPFANPPPGGPSMQADGNPDFESTFYQPLTGLVGGNTYTLSFWQAAGQQTGFSGATTEQWIVFLGTAAPTLTCHSSGNPNPNYPGAYCTYNANGDLVATSAVMNTPSGGTSPWEQANLSFNLPSGAAAHENVYFLAWGNGGSTVNLPPTVFLAGVNTPAQAPRRCRSSARAW